MKKELENLINEVTDEKLGDSDNVYGTAKRKEVDLSSYIAFSEAMDDDEVKPLKKFLNAVFPLKNDNPFEIVRKIVLLASSAAVIACLAYFISDAFIYDGNYENNNKVLVAIKESGQVNLAIETVEVIQKEVPGIRDDYLELYNLNNDIVGWIKIGETLVNYPVVQCKGKTVVYDGEEYDGNEYYLDHNFDRNKSKKGAIYADWHSQFTPEARPNNAVFYGHNIADGSCFAYVSHYNAPVYGMNVYRNNPVIEFNTLYEDGLYKIFAGIFVNTQEAQGAVYNYYQKTSFTSEAEFMDFCANIMDRSCFYTDVDLEYGDEIITLSTCYYPFGNNIDCRFALFARRVREGESPEVDTEAAYLNPSPLYFDYYYRVNGGSWAGRNWDISKVKDFDKYNTESIGSR